MTKYRELDRDTDLLAGALEKCRASVQILSEESQERVGRIMEERQRADLAEGLVRELEARIEATAAETLRRDQQAYEDYLDSKEEYD